MEIKAGETYKNFAGNFREVKIITEGNSKLEKKVIYYDGTGKDRTCTLETFEQWIKKNYY